MLTLGVDGDVQSGLGNGPGEARGCSCVGISNLNSLSLQREHHY